MANPTDQCDVSEGSLKSCPHRPPCAACPRFGEVGIAAGALAALNALAHVHALPPVSVISGATAGFRLRARLAIRGRVGSPKIGLFESGTHRVVHIPRCIVQHPLINRVAGVVRRALAESRVSCYSDTAHLGLARYLQVVVERSSQTAQLVLVANCETPEPVAACLSLIRERLAGDLHSLWFNANLGTSNAILGSHLQHLHGPESVVEHFGGGAVHYPPGAFGQNNLDIAQDIVAHVRSLIPANSSIAEFYAGVGAIGLSVLSQADSIRMNETAPHSLRGLELGILQLDPASRMKISVLAGDAGEMRTAATGVQVVIADPPRKGLDTGLAEHLREHPPERFIYVSCGLDSFLNDTARLTARGNLRLRSLTAFNLMPFTEHVETVGCFDRA